MSSLCRQTAVVLNEQRYGGSLPIPWTSEVEIKACGASRGRPRHWSREMVYMESKRGAQCVFSCTQLTQSGLTNSGIS
jgi:hypothetical protein